MPYMYRTLSRWIVIGALVGPTIIYFPTGLIFGGRVAIEIGNAILLPLSIGVTLVYAPVFWEALTHGPKVPWHRVLGAGIFIGFLGVAFARVFSIVWRAAGQDPAWLDSVVWGSHIPLSIAAALGHILAPKAIDGIVPTIQWIKLGALVSAGLLFASLVVYLL